MVGPHAPLPTELEFPAQACLRQEMDRTDKIGVDTVAEGAEAAVAAGWQTGSPLGLLCIFHKLGATCLGGPITHIGYFREEFVVRRRWLDKHAYADLVGLC